jgi:hypothetical protein
MSAPSGRVYSAYDVAYEHRPEEKRKHAERVKARRHMIARYGKAALQGKDVDHIVALEGGGSNTPSNWRVRGIHSNRADKTFN